MAAAVFRPALYEPAVTLPPPYVEGTVFPLSLSSTDRAVSTDDLVSSIGDLANAGQIAALLRKHGAIYFQNLGLEDAQEFSRFAHAFHWLPHEDIGNPVRRTVLAKNVATANEGPNTQPVYPHNEFGLSPHYPSYVLFFCISAPETGGETPINNSVILYQRLKEKHPVFINELEKKGVKYQLFYPNGPKDQTESARTTLRQSYGLHILDTDGTETARAKVEKEICRLPTATWAWENRSETNPLGDLRVWQQLPAIRNHPRIGEPAFFNNIVSRFLTALSSNTLEPPHINKDGRYQPPAYYGDGTLIPRVYLESAVEIINETRSLVSWTAGDVLLLDNHAVQHAREPWTGPRKLLASLWDHPAV
ncbi:Clavaminate synthase-like protein [Pleurostoma richardsiae]|uniref:Clavaminate synthase-like protein n=1 Tax=Pleurostoma richardsiae TaxID=41990 RepID=A0AA38VHA8_9PEZI|nr:Clavaminate synthase-like protein [Pleurostoma richardsiae]